MMAKGHGASFSGDENVLKSIVAMIAQFCDYIKNHRIVYVNGQVVTCVNYISMMPSQK